MSIRVGLGLSDYPFSGAQAFWRWVRLCEAGGVDSLWQSDRLVGTTPMLECLSMMAALAGATKRLKFGMNVLALSFRDPLIVAKACATIDHLSGGRLIAGFGLGAPGSPDWRAAGIESAGSGTRADEALEIMIRLWRGDCVTYEGEHFRYSDVAIRPLPAQQPLPVWLGGSSAAAVRRTARFGTGWHAGLLTPEEAAESVAAIRSAALAAGRPIDPGHFGATFFFHLGEADAAVLERHREGLRRRMPGIDPDKTLAVGAPALIRRLQAFEAGGITKFILLPLHSGEADMFGQTQGLIEKILPQVQGAGSLVSA